MKRIVLSLLVAMISLTAISQDQKSKPQVQVDTVFTKLLTEKFKKFGKLTGSYLTKEVWDVVMRDLDSILGELYSEYTVPKKTQIKSEPKKD